MQGAEDMSCQVLMSKVFSIFAIFFDRDHLASTSAKKDNFLKL